MKRERHMELLQSCPYFAELSDDLLETLLGVVTVRSYAPGESIFFEGQDAGKAALHIVESGTVRVLKISVEGREQVLRIMREGDSFADVPAFDGGGYPANAAALDASTVLTIPRQPLLALMRKHPDIALGALGTMASRLRHMTGLVEDLSLRRVMSRVAHLLQANQGGANLSQSQMAAMVGTAREMVNRSLNSLADQQIIELRGQEIVIVDPERLSQVVENG